MPADPTQRTLALLSLLSSGTTWSGVDLAERTETTVRTVRRDVDRLRSAGYDIDAVSGPGGGYALRAGAKLAPLVLHEDEALAIAAALLVAAEAHGTGMTASTAAALDKLQRLLPARLSSPVDALTASASAVHLRSSPAVDPTALRTLSTACRERTIVAFGYRTRADAASERRVEPARLVTARGAWYLVAFDLDRSDWRLFRVDRMVEVRSTGHGIVDRPPPDGGPMGFFVRSLAATAYAHEVEVALPRPRDRVLADAPALNPHRVTAGPAGTCIVRIGADTADALARELIALSAGAGGLPAGSVRGDAGTLDALAARARELAAAVAAAS